MDGQGVLIKQGSTDFDQPFEVHRDITKLVAVGDNINVAIDVTPGGHPAGMWIKSGAALVILRLWGAEAETDISALPMRFKIFMFPRSRKIKDVDPQAVAHRQGTGMLMADLTVKLGGLPLVADRHPVLGRKVGDPGYAEAATDFYEMSNVTLQTALKDADIVRLIGDVDDGTPMFIRLDLTGAFGGVYVEPVEALNVTRIVVGIGRMM